MSPVKKFLNVRGLPDMTAWSREPASRDERAVIKQLGDAAASGEIQQEKKRLLRLFFMS